MHNGSSVADFRDFACFGLGFLQKVQYITNLYLTESNENEYSSIK